MNRKSRRAAIKNERRNAVAPRHDTDIDDLFAEAGRLYQQGQFLRAQEACRQILAREPSHAAANNLRGVIFQALRRDRIAIEHFTKAIALEPSYALFQYNIAFSYQRLDLWDDAVAHFTKAIELKMDGRPIEGLIAQYPVIASSNPAATRTRRSASFPRWHSNVSLTNICSRRATMKPGRRKAFAVLSWRTWQREARYLNCC